MRRRYHRAWPARRCGTPPIFLSDVKARRDKMVGLVEMMRMTADGLRLTAYGPDEDEIHVVEDAANG